MTEKPKTMPKPPFWQWVIPMWFFILIVILSITGTYFVSQDEPEFITVFATPQLYGAPQTDFTFIETLSSPTPMDSLQLTAHAELTTNTPMCGDLERSSSGQYVFRMFPQNGMELYRIDEDGMNFCRLTNNSGNDDYPVWSPDGESIAFVSNVGDYGLYLMDANGENVELLHTGGTAYSYPSWSPDGSYLIFQATFDEVFDIYQLELATGEITNLTNQERLDNMARYSPSGEFIVFTSDRTFNPYVNTNPLGQSQAYEIYMMNSDGTNSRRLTVNSSVDELPSFSPDNSQIAFRAHGQIMIMNRDGSGLRELIYGNDPLWLSDGRIAYVAEAIHTIQPDGTENTAISFDIPVFGSGIRMIDYTAPR